VEEEEVEAMLGIREDEAWEGSVIVSKMVIYKDYLENGGGSVRRRQYALGKADGRWNIGESRVEVDKTIRKIYHGRRQQCLRSQLSVSHLLM